MFCRALVCIGVLLASDSQICAQTHRIASSLTAAETGLSLLIARNRSMAGDFATARAILDGALAVLPDSADLLNGRGAVEQDMGEYRLAERSYRAALVRSNPADILQRARVLNNLATLYVETGQRAKADSAGAELEALPFAPIEAIASDAATVLSTLAAVRRARGDDLGAEPLYERSAYWWKRAGHADAMVAHVTTSLGNLHFDTRQYEEASMLFQRAAAQIESRVGRDHPLLIRALYGLAACEFHAGDAKAAEATARRASAIARVRMGRVHPFTAKTLLLHAQLLRKLGRKRDAAAEEKEAKEIVRDISERNLAGHTVDVRDLRGPVSRDSKRTYDSSPARAPA